MCGNHDAMLETSREEFIRNDQDLLIRKYDLEADDNFLYINVLNSTYKIDRIDGYITEKDNERKPAHDVMMAIYDLFNYHADESFLPQLFGAWKSVADLGGMLGAGHAKRLYNESVIAPFTGKADKLKEACLALGGKEASEGDVSFIIPVFDFFPVWMQFWDADDEFPADIRFLWDQNSEAFLHYEIVFYLTMHIEALLTEMIN